MNEQQLETYMEMKHEALVKELNFDRKNPLVKAAVENRQAIERNNMDSYADLLEAYLLPKLQSSIQEQLDDLSERIKDALCPDQIALHEISFNSVSYEDSLVDKLRMMSTLDEEVQKEIRYKDNEFCRMMKDFHYESTVGVYEDHRMDDHLLMMKEVKLFRIFTHTDLAWRLAIALSPNISVHHHKVPIKDIHSCKPGEYQVYKYVYTFFYNPFGVSKEHFNKQVAAFTKLKDRKAMGSYRTLGTNQYLDGSWDIFHTKEVNAPKRVRMHSETIIDPSDPVVKNILKLLDEIDAASE